MEEVITGREETREIVESKIIEMLQGKPDSISGFYNSIYTSSSFNTQYRYVEYIINFLEAVDKAPEEVTMDDINGYLNRLSRGNGGQKKSGSYLVAIYSALKKYYSYMVKSGRIDKSPVENVERPKPKPADQIQRTYLKPEEVNECMRKIKEEGGYYQKRNLAMMVIYFATGIRNSALVDINVDNVNIDEGFIYVIDKGDKARKCYLSEDNMNVIKDWIKERNERNPKTKALFINKCGKRITTQGTSYVVKSVSSKIGHKISPHKARASFCTNTYNAGVPLDVVSKLMNHASTGITSRCYVLGQEEKEKNNVLKATSYIKI